MSISLQTDLTMSDLLKGDLQLTSPPAIYFELKKIIEDASKNANEIAFVIENDPSLTAKLLKIVNSAFYGFPARITSISRAITIIGSVDLQNLVLSTIIIERFSKLPGNLISMHDFWAKSLRCALISKELDAILGKQYHDAAFVCGLLHNIGHLVFLRRIPELAREVSLQLQAKPEIKWDDEVTMEKDVIGFDHFQMGAELCRFWNLPKVISESIRLHHYPDNTETFCNIASITRLANYYSDLELDHDGLISKSIGISEQQINLILDKVYDQFDEIFSVFYPAKL